MNTPDNLRQIAVVRSYDELIAAMRTRADAIKLTRVALDDAMKTLPDGYASKLLSPVPMKTLGRVSFGPMLQVMGLKIILVEDTEAMERVQRKVAQRKKITRTGRSNASQKKRRRWRFPKGPDHARLMRARQLAHQTPEKRSSIARAAGRARWKKQKNGDYDRGSIYVIEAANGKVKIGKSSNPEQRLATLRTASVLELKLAYVHEVKARLSRIERAVHKALKSHRLTGEWFACTVQDAIAAIDSITRVELQKPA